MKINFIDIPKYSNLPKKIIYSTNSDIRFKTKSEVIREYENERWGSILKYFNEGHIQSLESAEELYADLEVESVFFENGEFYIGKGSEILQKYIELCARSLIKHATNASALVELGAGFGSKILSLSRRVEFQNIPLYAAEYTNAGQKLIKLIADYEKINVEVGYCDLKNLEINGMDIPKNSLIFTSYSTHYTPLVSCQFVDFIAKYEPLAVVHFEPFYEHHSEENLYGILCRRYIEINDYTRNFHTVIEGGCKRLGYTLNITRNVMGMNPLLPISIVEWFR